jgi:hypothetical protein
VIPVEMANQMIVAVMSPWLRMHAGSTRACGLALDDGARFSGD